MRLYERTKPASHAFAAAALATTLTACGARSGLLEGDDPSVNAPPTPPDCEPAPPNSAWLALRVGDADDRQLRTVLVTEMDASSAVALTQSGERPKAVQWSPDGRYLAFEAEAEDDLPVVIVVRMDCAAPERVLTHRADRFAWGPGAQLAMVDAADSTLFVLDVGRETEPRAVLTLDFVGFVAPAPAGSIMAVKTRDDLLVIDAAAASPVAHPVGVDGLAVEWAPDGTQFSFGADDGFYVATLGPGGTPQATRVSAPAPADTDVLEHLHAWSADSRWLGFQMETSPEVSELFVYDRSTQVVEQPAPHLGVRTDEWEFAPDSSALYVRQRIPPASAEELSWVALGPPWPSQPLNPPALEHEAVTAYAWARNGAAVVYRSDREDDQGFELYLASGLDATPTIEKISAPLAADRAVTGAAMAAEGTRMLYVTSQRKPLTHPPRQLFYADLSGTPVVIGPLATAHQHGLDLLAAWKPDGGALAYIADGAAFLQRIGDDGPAPPQLLWEGPNTVGADVHWQPDVRPDGAR
jgi:dipeptidyl aminopeptidase/acylaminoacyl peptidase